MILLSDCVDANAMDMVSFSQARKAQNQIKSYLVILHFLILGSSEPDDFLFFLTGMTEPRPDRFGLTEQIKSKQNNLFYKPSFPFRSKIQSHWEQKRAIPVYLWKICPFKYTANKTNTQSENIAFMCMNCTIHKIWNRHRGSKVYQGLHKPKF